MCSCAGRGEDGFDPQRSRVVDLTFLKIQT